jgi:hypothetical protein
LLLACLTASLHAQSGQKAALAAVEQLRQRYLEAHGLHMDISYYYANASSPQRYLDSVKGSFIMDGTRYHFRMDSTEGMVNERYSIMVFSEDKLLYLTKPAAQPSSSYNPVSMLDSLATQGKGAVVDLQQQGPNRMVSIQFPKGMNYGSMVLTIDTATGYMTRCLMTVRTALLAPAADGSSLKASGYDEYALVETRLQHYQQKELPVDFFSEQRFFSKDGKSYVAAERYRGYEVFVGTPGL